LGKLIVSDAGIFLDALLVARPGRAGRAIGNGFALKDAVIPDKLGEAERRSGTAASSEFTRRFRIFALRARPG